MVRDRVKLCPSARKQKLEMAVALMEWEVLEVDDAHKLDIQYQHAALAALANTAHIRFTNFLAWNNGGLKLLRKWNALLKARR
jgi:hypothetical protein